MKHVSLLLIIVLAGFFAAAQQTLTIPYQALVRDANGNPVTNQQIGAKVTLLAGSITGNVIFEETHTDTTNAFGQMELQIGSVNTAAFDTINWSTGKMFIRLEVDLQTGEGFLEIGTHQLLAVPFAKYAEEGSGWMKTEGGISFLQGKVGIGTDTLSSSSTNLQIAMNDPVIGGVRITNTDPTENNQALFRVDASANKGNALRIQRDGKVGIGIGSPTTLMQLKGTSISNFTGTTRGILTLSSDYQAGYYTAIDFLYTQGSNPTARIAAQHSGTGSKLVFGTSNTYNSGITNISMTINQLGNVGIGTEDPGANLHVFGGYSSYTPSNIEGLFVENNGVSNTSFVFQIATAGGGKSFSITNLGRVGIGTTNPGTYKLKVEGAFYATNMKTSSTDFIQIFKSLEEQTNISEQEAGELENLKFSDLQTFIENDSTVDLVKMNVFLLEKIDQLIKNNKEQQYEIKAQKAENVELRQLFLDIKSEIETLKNNQK